MNDQPPPEETELDGDIAITSPDFIWTDDPEEQRRAFVFMHMANADIDCNILIKNMQAIAEWLKLGTVPRPPQPRRAALKPVADG